MKSNKTANVRAELISSGSIRVNPLIQEDKKPFRDMKKSMQEAIMARRHEMSRKPVVRH